MERGFSLKKGDIFFVCYIKGDQSLRAAELIDPQPNRSRSVMCPIDIW